MRSSMYLSPILGADKAPNGCHDVSTDAAQFYNAKISGGSLIVSYRGQGGGLLMAPLVHLAKLLIPLGTFSLHLLYCLFSELRGSF